MYFEVGVSVLLFHISLPLIYLGEKKSLAAQRTEKIVCIGGRTKLSGRVATEDILFLLESGESGGKVFGIFFYYEQ